MAYLPIATVSVSLSQGQLHIYRHNDMRHLEALLQSCPAQMRKLVVTDSLFSMDGEAVKEQRLAGAHKRARAPGMSDMPSFLDARRFCGSERPGQAP